MSSEKKSVGSRAEVYHNNAEKTPGGLRKKDLYKNKRGRIVSLKKSRTAKISNPLKKLGLLSKSGEGFGSRTYHKGSISKTRRGRNGQRVEDFVTHKGTAIMRHGKKYKAYDSRKGSVRKTNKWMLGRDYQLGGISGPGPLGYSSVNEKPVQMQMPNPTVEERALGASGGRRLRGGSLAMTNLDSAYPTKLSHVNMGSNSPFNRSIHAGI